MKFINIKYYISQLSFFGTEASHMEMLGFEHKAWLSQKRALIAYHHLLVHIRSSLHSTTCKIVYNSTQNTSTFSVQQATLILYVKNKIYHSRLTIEFLFFLFPSLQLWQLLLLQVLCLYLLLSHSPSQSFTKSILNILSQLNGAYSASVPFFSHVCCFITVSMIPMICSCSKLIFWKTD